MEIVDLHRTRFEGMDEEGGLSAMWLDWYMTYM